MKIDVLLGLQWGDEGKGKIIDVLTPKYDIIARFQGGPNAGHTLEFNGQKHVLHLIPSGIFHPDKVNLLGNGMVIDPIAFKEEVEGLKKFIPMEELKKRIVISNRATLILPTHRLLDQSYEAAKGGAKIGTTGKGIGPAYTDHISRNAVLVGDICYTGFGMKCGELESKHCNMLTFLKYEFDTQTLCNQDNSEFFRATDFMKEFEMVNSSYWLDKQLNAGKTVLAEGAQGTLLDIDHGNYPFVTSSNTTIGGVCTGLGIAANRIGKVYGLFKAYCTRVGMGPFPTELGGKKSDEWCATKSVTDENELYPDANINDSDSFIKGIALRKKGFEFGATTGRLRRTGWLDIPALRYACMINGVTDLVISKADVLSGFEMIDVCIKHSESKEYEEYVVLGHTSPRNPMGSIFRGWSDLTKITNYADLPGEFKRYLKLIEEETGRPISIISTGPDRKQFIIHEKEN